MPICARTTIEIVPIIEVTPIQYKNFSCGYAALDEYLKRYAKVNHRKNIGKTFVLIQEDEVIGFYTLSMGNIEFQSIPPKLQSGLPKYPIPVARIGRLAVTSEVKGRGFGKFLFVDAIHKIWAASSTIAAYAAVVDAKDLTAMSFYQHLGFIPFEEQSLTLFLPLSSFEGFFKTTD